MYLDVSNFETNTEKHGWNMYHISDTKISENWQRENFVRELKIVL